MSPFSPADLHWGFQEAHGPSKVTGKFSPTHCLWVIRTHATIPDKRAFPPRFKRRVFVWFSFYYIVNIGARLSTHRDRSQERTCEHTCAYRGTYREVHTERPTGHTDTQSAGKSPGALVPLGVQPYTEHSKASREQKSVDKRCQLKSSHVCCISDNDNTHSLMTSPGAKGLGNLNEVFRMVSEAGL